MHAALIPIAEERQNSEINPTTEAPKNPSRQSVASLCDQALLTWGSSCLGRKQCPWGELLGHLGLLVLLNQENKTVLYPGLGKWDRRRLGVQAAAVERISPGTPSCKQSNGQVGAAGKQQWWARTDTEGLMKSSVGEEDTRKSRVTTFKINSNAQPPMAWGEAHNCRKTVGSILGSTQPVTALKCQDKTTDFGVSLWRSP